MSTINISVLEKDKIQSKTVNKIRIIDGNIELKSSVTFTVLLMNSNSEVLSKELVKIEGDEYSNWGSDDQYILNLVLSKLGLTQIA